MTLCPQNALYCCSIQAHINDLIDRAVRAGRYQADPNFPNDESLRQYDLVLETHRETSNTRVDEQSVNATVEVSGADAPGLTDPGSAFSEAAALSFISPNAGQQPAPADPVPKAKAKGKCKAKAKAKAEAANEEAKKTAPTTPLEKGMHLKKSAFL